MEVRRTAFGDGEPPAYVFTSPCCGAPAVLAAWIIEYAAARTRGQLLIECGRYGADPLRTVRADGAGCGRRYVVVVRARRPPTAVAAPDPVGHPPANPGPSQRLMRSPTMPPPPTDTSLP
jgi:hypothetical protein